MVFSTDFETALPAAEGVQSLDDESWAMDNLRVSVSAVPEPGSTAMLLAGGLGLAAFSAARARRPRPPRA